MALELATTERQTLSRVWEDPALFSEHILRHTTWDVQKEILRAVAHHPRVAVKACHASGKTFTAAEAVLWWVTVHDDGIVVTTAPTWKQVEKLLWGEIHKAVFGCRLAYPPLNRTELRLGPNNYALGISTNQGVNFQGWHGAKLLIVIDEALGVEPMIWEAIEGIRAGGDVHVMALGNPVTVGGPFYDAFTSQRSTWWTKTIGAFDTPNLAGLTLESLLELPESEMGIAPMPYLVRRRWVKEKWYEWGEGHPLWESRVLGQFPTQAENAVFSLASLEAAREREFAPYPRNPRHVPAVEAGVDVAGPGEDETVVYIRKGPNILEFSAFSQADPRGAVVSMLAKYRDDLGAVRVDSIGIGWNFYLHLRDQGFPAEPINVAEAAYDKEKFRRRKDELYWSLRQRLIDGDIAGLIDETTIGQLSVILYEHNARGQVEVESKEDMRERGVRSPDRAEALMLAFAPPGVPHGLELPEFPRESPYYGRI